MKEAENINAYLVSGGTVEVEKVTNPFGPQAEMTFGNTPIDGGHLLLSADEVQTLGLSSAQLQRFVRKIYGSAEFIRGLLRFCLWIEDKYLDEALSIPAIHQRIESVRAVRIEGGTTAKDIAARSHQFQRMNVSETHTIVVPGVSSENRPYLPVGVVEGGAIISNKNFRPLRCPPLEHGADRLAPALGLDWHCLCADAH
jgi:hypothetical protein